MYYREVSFGNYIYRWFQPIFGGLFRPESSLPKSTKYDRNTEGLMEV